MFRYDQVLIVPDKRQLHKALTAAAVAANKGCRSRKIVWQEPYTKALVQASAKNAEGFRQWNAEGDRRQSSGQETQSSVAVAWWTDPIGRVHYRIVAGRNYMFSEPYLENLLCPLASIARPPLMLVYPDNVYFDETDGTATLRAICLCGASGAPSVLE